LHPFVAAMVMNCFIYFPSPEPMRYNFYLARQRQMFEFYCNSFFGSQKDFGSA